MSFYVDITHKTKADLEGVGLYVVAEGDQFYILRGKDQADHIVQKNSTAQYIYVDDVNDAICLGSRAIISVNKA